MGQQVRQTFLRVMLIFHGGAKPDVGWPVVCPPVNHRCHILWTLGEEQPIQPRCLANQSPETFPLGIEFGLVFKHITHAGTEHAPANRVLLSLSIPFQWFSPVSIPEDPAWRPAPPQPMTHAVRPSFRITVFTGWGYLGATPPWIESVVGPFDG